MDDKLQTRSIRAKNGVGAGVRDIGPPLAVSDRDFRNFEGVVPKELDRLYRLDLVGMTGSTPVIRFGLPTTDKTVRVTTVP